MVLVPFTFLKRFVNVVRSSVTANQAKSLVENIHIFNSTAFDTDCSLDKELISFVLPGMKPLGLILISPVFECINCGSRLILRKYCHASVINYLRSYNMRSIPGAHFHILCQNRSCCCSILWLLHVH